MQCFVSPVSPLRPKSGEPQSAPPSVSRPSMAGDHTHAIIYKSDINSRVSQHSNIYTLMDVTLGHKLGQIDLKWEKSGIF